MPIAHMEGSYFCDAATLAELERNKQVIFRYVHPDGRAAGVEDFAANPNGALAPSPESAIANATSSA